MPLSVSAPRSATGGAVAAAAIEDLLTGNGCTSVKKLQQIESRVQGVKNTPRQPEILHSGKMHQHERGLQHNVILDVGEKNSEGRRTDAVRYDAMDLGAASSSSGLHPTASGPIISNVTSKPNPMQEPNAIASVIFALDGAAQPHAPRRLQFQAATNNKNARDGTTVAGKSTAGNGKALPPVSLRRRSVMTPWFHMLEKEGQPLMFKELKLGLRAGLKKI